RATALSPRPGPARSPWPSPSMLSRRTILRSSTGLFQTPVCTVRPCQGTSFGSPTLTETRVATRPSYALAFAERREPSHSGLDARLQALQRRDLRGVRVPVGWNARRVQRYAVRPGLDV